MQKPRNHEKLVKFSSIKILKIFNFLFLINITKVSPESTDPRIKLEDPENYNQYIFKFNQFQAHGVDLAEKAVIRRLSDYGCYCYSVFGEGDGGNEKISNMKLDPVDEIDQLCYEFQLSKTCFYQDFDIDFDSWG